MTRLSAEHQLSLGLLAASLLGCASDFEPGSRVNSLRVLAVQADAPYASPGETVQLTSLSYDPEARPITWAWATCPTPQAATVESCLEAIAEQTKTSSAQAFLAMGEGLDSFAVTLPEDSLDGIEPEALALAFTGVLSIACPGDLEFGVDDDRLPFRCRDPQTGRDLGLDEYVVGVKRVFLRASDRNQNPSILRVLFDGEEWAPEQIMQADACDTSGNTFDDCPAQLRHRISVEVTPPSFETGLDEFGRDFSEQLIVQYYASEGIYEDEVRVADSPETGWVARRAASGTLVRFWFVARDDRGGVTWTERSVQVR